MKNVASLLLGVALCAAVLFAFRLELPWPLLTTVVAGAICLALLVVIVVLPWNLYFQARHLLFESERSKKRGIAVEPEHQVEARRVVGRMLRVSVGLHVGSAALLATCARLYGEPLGYAFAGLFLLSTFFRPGFEYYRFLRARLGQSLIEVSFPRDDVQRLVAEVKHLLRDQGEQGRALVKLREDHGTLAVAVVAGDREGQRQLDAVARKFEETIDRLTDNQEIISGIKAFLRLVQVPRPAQ